MNKQLFKDLIKSIVDYDAEVTKLSEYFNCPNLWETKVFMLPGNIVDNAFDLLFEDWQSDLIYETIYSLNRFDPTDENLEDLYYELFPED